MRKKDEPRVLDLRTFQADLKKRDLKVSDRYLRSLVSHGVLPRPRLKGKGRERRSRYDPAWVDTVERIWWLRKSTNGQGQPTQARKWPYKKIRRVQEYVRRGGVCEHLHPVLGSLARLVDHSSLLFIQRHGNDRALDDTFQRLHGARQELERLRTETLHALRRMRKMESLVDEYRNARNRATMSVVKLDVQDYPGI